MGIRLITDSSCDLPYNFVKANHIDIASLQVNIRGTFYKDDLGQTIEYTSFYKLLREGETTSTSQVNVNTFEELFEQYAKVGDSIIFIGMAGVLSGTINSALMARNSILERYPEADITVIDSKSATLGEGALVYEAYKKIEQGCTKEQVIQWVMDNRKNTVHTIVVEDLSFLKRGGRISSTTSLVGSLLNIKPSVKLDEEGCVVQGPKLKGSKALYNYLVDVVKEKSLDIKEQKVFIGHGDYLEGANKLKSMLMQELGVKEVIISTMGAVIGTHVGPNALGVFFIGKER